MNIVFFGTGAFGIPSLNVLKNSSHKILRVVTAPDKPQGRNLKSKPSPVKRWAEHNEMPVFQPQDVNSPGSAAELEKYGANLFVVISYGAILSRRLIEMPRLMTLNVHSSLLPRYRGAAPIHWAMIDGNTETGVSVMRMVEKLDAGDVILQKKTTIEMSDDMVSLEQRLSALGAEALLEAISRIEKKSAIFTPQDEKFSSYARKLKKEDGHIAWDEDASKIHALARALKVWPGVFSFYNEKRLRILDIFPTRERSVSPAGTLRVSEDRRRIFVSAGDFLMEITEIQLEGRKPLAAAEFLKGFSLESGQRLE